MRAFTNLKKSRKRAGYINGVESGERKFQEWDNLMQADSSQKVNLIRKPSSKSQWQYNNLFEINNRSTEH